MYSNPVINSDFPDPSCLQVKDTFYVFATNSCQTPGHIQVATSHDLVQYQLQPDALPNLPTWAKPGRTWAPNVTHIQDSTSSTFVMYFVAWDADTDRQAIGLATSNTPEGPYQPTEPNPLIAQAAQGGSIDPFVFTDDDGKHWLLFKNDGNAIGQPTHIYICPLTSDALQLAGEPQVMIKDNQPWEGHIVEAPFMWKHNGRFYLFYSGNAYGSPHYAVGYAVSDCITGPYEKSQAPVINGHGLVKGPGACCLVRGPRHTTWMLYHSWSGGSHQPYRAMSIAELKWHGSDPVVHTTWGEQQPAPFDRRAS